MVLSAPLLTRLKTIKVALETVKGTKVAGTQAILVFDPEINPTAPFEQRKGSGNYRGNEQVGVHGERSGVCKFSVEMRGNGLGDLEAGLKILVQAAGLKDSTGTYTVHSDHTNDKTISIDVWQDGVKKGLAGASGKVTFEGEVGKRLMCNFEFFGVWQTPIDEAMPVHAPSTAVPVRIQGGTFTIDAETIKIGKYSLDMGNEVIARMDANAAGGIAYYMITDQDPVLSLDPEADKVAGYDYFGKWLAGTEAAISLALSDGTNTFTISTPKVQYKEITEGDRDGIQIYEVAGQCNHSAGDDAVQITVV